jgi:hypothetical protein
MRIIIIVLLLCCNNYWLKAEMKETSSLMLPDSSIREDNSALLFLEQQIYTCPFMSIRNQLLIQKATVLKQQGQYLESFHTLTRIDLDSLTSNELFTVLYEESLMNYLASDYQNAAFYLRQMRNELVDTNQINACEILQTSCELQLENWESAWYHAHRYLNRNHLTSKTFDSIWRSEFPKILSVKKATQLACLYPGLGNLYARNYKMGWLNAISFSAVAALTVLHLLNGYYLIPAFSGVGLCLRFYMGSIKTSKASVLDFNKRQNDTFKKHLLNTLFTSAIALK